MKYLHIDIETYSDVDLTKAGVYKYVESSEFEILILAYAVDDGPVTVLDVYHDGISEEFKELFYDKSIQKVAHNAQFERVCLNAIGYETAREEWTCTAVLSTYVGLARSLHDLSVVLKLGDKAKDSRGRALIKYFSCPQKPTKRNGFKIRNYPLDKLDDWEIYKEYCAQDVVAEQAIHSLLSRYVIPKWEADNYYYDQKINDTGVLINTKLAESAKDLAEVYKSELASEFTELTGVQSARSTVQLKKYLDSKGYVVDNVRKEYLQEYSKGIKDPTVLKALKIRSEISKSSTAKYEAMLKYACKDRRARGTFQFYGARTGRWAGRGIQFQNMTKDKGIMDLDFARQMLIDRDFEGFRILYPDVQDALSQLVRTAIEAPDNKLFAVADYSAIEARVIAWLAGEKWRLDVFNSHGKIYEASAAMMFNVPFESIDKKSPLRQKGKVAELALGYQGSLGAMKAMGAEKMGLSDLDIQDIVWAWRSKSPAIVKFWGAINEACVYCVLNKNRSIEVNKYINVVFDGNFLIITLPSGRALFYPKAKLGENRFGGPSVQYWGQKENKFCWLDSYGGSYTENIVQAIARDLLMYSMRELDKEGYPVCLHVHDEVVCEVDEDTAEEDLKIIEKIMTRKPLWAKGLPLNAEGFVSKYYKK